ncbi:MAG: acyl-CoA desaturase [Acidobacteriota bacterium]
MQPASLEQHGTLTALIRWFDSWAAGRTVPPEEADRPDWLRIVPFAALHLGCLAVLWVGWSPVAVTAAVLLYLVRMFAVTGFYHRYFSHRTFKASRGWQFLFAVLGASAVQRGPLWWAAHHRHHHRHSDQETDLHSPVQHGLYWSHVGWIISKGNFRTNLAHVRDLARYPELVFLDRFDTLVPALLAAATFGMGELLEYLAPGLGTSGPQMLVWGFFVSTVVLFHATCTINSLAHLVGRRRYETGDHSRNSFLLALLTLGEGWHNNHHHFPASTRQGFFWWEIDMTYYLLRVLEWAGVVRDLRDVPDKVRLAERP